MQQVVKSRFRLKQSSTGEALSIISFTIIFLKLISYLSLLGEVLIYSVYILIEALLKFGCILDPGSTECTDEQWPFVNVTYALFEI